MFSLKEHNFDDLKNYMLSNINNKDSKYSKDAKNVKDNKDIEDVVINKDVLKVSKNLLYVDYNKAKKKYNNNFKYKEDPFFWCFYNLLNENDLMDDNLNILKIEKDTKINLLEELRKNKHKIKKKYRLSVLEDELLNCKNISFNTFCGLCCLKDISIFIITQNNSYSYFLNNSELMENSILNSYELFNFVELKYNNSLINAKNNSINTINISKNEYNNILNTYYYLENLEKPLKSITYYKLDDLITISNKLKILLYSDVNKKKTKKQLYSDIMNKLN